MSDGRGETEHKGQTHPHRTKKQLNEQGIASALSIDHWSPPESSKCQCEAAPDLSVNFLCMHPRPDEKQSSYTPKPPDKPAAARFQEIFVDFVGMQCASLDAASRQILDDRFDSFLGRGERDFKNALMKLMQDGMSTEARATAAYSTLDGILRSKMGFRNTYFWSNRKSYHREESKDARTFLERGTHIFSRLLTSSETMHSSVDPRTEIVRSILVDIQSNIEVCRRLQSSGEPSEDKVRAILQDTLSEESLDVLFSSLNDASLQEEARIFQSLFRPPGHVFVCNASVCDLHCDAFLCPGSIARRKHCISGSIPGRWLDSVKQNVKLQRHICPYELKRYEDHERVVTHQHWPWEEFRDNSLAPAPFFVGGEVSHNMSAGATATLPSSEEHIASLMKTARQFIDVALRELRSNQPKPLAGRERYLLAMPVIGTGGGFAGDLTGEVVGSLLSLMSDRAFAEDDVDLVLVCADEATFAHAQSIRLNLLRQIEEGSTAADRDNFAAASVLPCFRSWLTEEMRDQAGQLAELASSGHLALFLGAGASMGSGLPGWFSLLHFVEDLFTPNGDPMERKLGTATKWNPLHMADLLEGVCSSREDRHGVRATLKRRICDHINEYGERPGLLLSLLVSLPCQSVVTQNYDRLIERAFECWSIRDALSSKELSVIPYHPKRNARHWLLKMHGCTTSSEDIIISGKDYARYQSSRYKALGGLLQASLMTKHLLFVGFSLTDPNYLNIVEQVRSALHDDSSDTQGALKSSARNYTV